MSNKLLFTLNGSAARDRDHLEMSLSTAGRQQCYLDDISQLVDDIQLQAAADQTDVNVSVGSL